LPNGDWYFSGRADSSAVAIAISDARAANTDSGTESL
jgi:hypothetical protein